MASLALNKYTFQNCDLALEVGKHYKFSINTSSTNGACVFASTIINYSEGIIATAADPVEIKDPNGVLRDIVIKQTTNSNSLVTTLDIRPGISPISIDITELSDADYIVYTTFAQIMNLSDRVTAIEEQLQSK